MVNGRDGGSGSDPRPWTPSYGVGHGECEVLEPAEAISRGDRCSGLSFETWSGVAEDKGGDSRISGEGGLLSVPKVSSMLVMGFIFSVRGSWRGCRMHHDALMYLERRRGPSSCSFQGGVAVGWSSLWSTTFQERVTYPCDRVEMGSRERLSCDCVRRPTADVLRVPLLSVRSRRWRLASMSFIRFGLSVRLRPED